MKNITHAIKRPIIGGCPRAPAKADLCSVTTTTMGVAPGKYPHPEILEREVLVSTDPRYVPTYKGPLDFIFLVHPRAREDVVRAYPNLANESERSVMDTVRRIPVHITSPIRVQLNGRTLHGELVSVPYLPTEFRRRLRELRLALNRALAYCHSRHVRIVGLGALIPSITRHGRDLLANANGVGLTTGHAFTAHILAEETRAIERKWAALGVGILGAAGSMGNATLDALCEDGLQRKILLVDLNSRMGVLSDMASRLRTQFGHEVDVSAELGALKRVSIVVSVTNASSSILSPEHLTSGSVVIDDAQPPNITLAVAQKARVTVLKCLAQVPGLRCPFDYGLFPRADLEAKQDLVFTCLAETILIAASDHRGHFTIGRPTKEQLRSIAHLSQEMGFRMAPFHSFPEIGALSFC